MNREEMTMLGFEIVAFARDARSKLLEALTKAENGEYDEAEALVEAANQCIVEAHKSQTTLLTKEASGENLDLSFTMVHGQDHLMTTMLLKDVIHHLINFYRHK
ncbi:PTS lactose/cellobiose transporter subunit IIA [Streptococcus thoraltensis]|uniref:PTS lactose/cellobiose transporter subunit IIA n=1 Tax=Streptococcus thoraltensis TaxID=55085 RepID=UPI001F56109C|nr:PTS lactose/cellobiose transporter subunit IIA [Streptococcus thoraltensis]